MLFFLLCLISALRAQGLEALPVSLRSLGAGQALQVGPDGVVHIIGARTGDRIGAPEGAELAVPLAGGTPSSYGPLVYLRRERERWVLESVPGTGSGDTVHAAAMDVDDEGNPVVAFVGSHCEKKGDKTDCEPRLWLAIRNGEWKTKALSAPDGSYGEPAVNAWGNQSWALAVHWTEERKSKEQKIWSGVLRYRGSKHEKWLAGGGDTLVLLERGETLLHRKGTTLSLLREDRDRELVQGVRQAIGGVVSPSGQVLYSSYRPMPDTFFAGSGEGDSWRVGFPESGWHNDLAMLPDGRALAAWYYWRNPYNKGVMLGLQESEGWTTWPVVREEAWNIGWEISLDVGPEGSIHALVQNRSTKEMLYLRYGSLDEARAAAVPPQSSWTDRRRFLSLFGYAGAWYHWTQTTTSAPSSEDFDFGDFPSLAGDYELEPGLARAVGFSGRIGKVDLALEYLDRHEQDPAMQQIQELRGLAGKLGIQSIPIPGTETQLHFRTADIKGSYKDPAGFTSAYETNERLVELRFVYKSAWHAGLRYHNFASPQDVYYSKDFEILDAYIADAVFTGGAVVGGWSLMDYIKKYEIRYFGPHANIQGGIGYLSVDLRRRNGGGSETHGLAYFPAEADLGLTLYKRWKKAGGLGVYAQLGGRGSVVYAGSGEPDEKDEEDADTEYWINATHLDLRYGPYLRVGGMF